MIDNVSTKLTLVQIGMLMTRLTASRLIFIFLAGKPSTNRIAGTLAEAESDPKSRTESAFSADYFAQDIRNYPMNPYFVRIFQLKCLFRESRLSHG